MTAPPPPVLCDLPGWLDALERDVVHRVTCDLYAPWLDPVLIHAQSKVVAVPLLAAVLGLLALRRPRAALRAALTCLLGFAVAMGLASVLWAAWPRARPSRVYREVLRTPEALAECASRPEALALRMSSSKSPSFPSRHALTIGLAVTAVWLASRRLGVLAVLYGALAALGRIYGGKHWPSDVLAGLALGAAVGWAVWRLLPPLLDRAGRGAWVREAPPRGAADERG